MPYYDNFLKTCKHPKGEWLGQTQAFLDDSFNNASSYTHIEMENEFGSLEFHTIEARVTKLLDSKVGDKINDDYRALFFPDIHFMPELGSRFRFDDNIWIVYSTDNYKSLNSTCYIQRCNNTINLQDKYGNIHEEPCVIIIKPTKSTFLEQEYMYVPYAKQVIRYQQNEWTKALSINSRIMYVDQTYRIGVDLNFNRTQTFNKDSVKLITSYLDMDLLNEYDNLELQVADYRMPNYKIFSQTILQKQINTSGILNAEVYLDDDLVDEEVNWYSTDESIISIVKETGEYTTTGIGNATIVAKLKNNEYYKTDINIAIVDNVDDIYETIIDSNDYYVPLNQTYNYNVFEYLNGEKIDTKFSFAFSQVTSKYYTKTVADNSFSVKNLLQNEKNLLKVSITNLRNNEVEDIYIELGGLF